MAELLTRAATEIAAGRKVTGDTQNRKSVAVVEFPTTHAVCFSSATNSSTGRLVMNRMCSAAAS